METDMEVASSETSLEERILQNNYSNLYQGIAHPFKVATELVKKKVVDKALVSKLKTPAMDPLQQNEEILSAVCCSVHNNSSHFQLLLDVLENVAESASLARKMRAELSELTVTEVPMTPETSTSSSQMTGRNYHIGDCYRKDYVCLQDEFVSMFELVQEKVERVSVNDLKQYLCRFDELRSLLQDADTLVKIMNAVREQSTLTDFAYIDRIAHHFGNRKVKSKVSHYKKSLKKFCRHTIQAHTYVQSFCEDQSKPIPSTNKVTFKLEWNATETTMNDIRGILRKAFGRLADRVKILVVREGCVLLECAAPPCLMKDLVGVASRRKHELVAMDVVKLTIGSTEVINEQRTKRVSAKCNSDVLSYSHMKTVRNYSQVSPEECILNNDLMRIADPLSVAILLIECGVVDPLLFSKLTTSGMYRSQQIAAIISAVSISVRINPSCFPVVLYILEDEFELALELALKLSTPETCNHDCTNSMDSPLHMTAMSYEAEMDGKLLFQLERNIDQPTDKNSCTRDSTLLHLTTTLKPTLIYSSPPPPPPPLRHFYRHPPPTLSLYMETLLNLCLTGVKKVRGKERCQLLVAVQLGSDHFQLFTEFMEERRAATSTLAFICFLFCQDIKKQCSVKHQS